MKKRINAFARSMQVFFDETGYRDVTVEQLLRVLGQKGQAALLVLLSLPFCQPIQIPGFSTPFGLILAFLGLRLAFGHKIWLPRVILDKKISYETLNKIMTFAIKVTDKLLFFVSKRMSDLVSHPAMQIANGLTIAFLGIILSLPLPIPLSNILAAYPLLIFGLALLEEDGAALLVAYALSAVCFTVLGLLIWFGKEGLCALFS